MSADSILGASRDFVVGALYMIPKESCLTHYWLYGGDGKLTNIRIERGEPFLIVGLNGAQPPAYWPITSMLVLVCNVRGETGYVCDRVNSIFSAFVPYTSVDEAGR
jgi:hypothetical protein